MVLKALVLEVQVLRLRVPPLHLLFSFSLVLELVLWKALPRLILSSLDSYLPSPFSIPRGFTRVQN